MAKDEHEDQNFDDENRILSDTEIQEIVADRMHAELLQGNGYRWSARYNLPFTEASDPTDPDHKTIKGEAFSFRQLVLDTTYLFGNGRPFLPNIPLHIGMGQTLRDDLISDNGADASLLADAAKNLWSENLSVLQGPVFVHSASEIDPTDDQLSMVAMIYVNSGASASSPTTINNVSVNSAYAIYGVARRGDPEAIVLGQAVLNIPAVRAARNSSSIRTQDLLGTLENFAFRIQRQPVQDVERASFWKAVYPERGNGGSQITVTIPPIGPKNPHGGRR